MLGRRQIILLLAAAATLAVAWAVKPVESRADESRAWRVGFPPWIAYDMSIYAEEAGLFDKHGLDVELIRFDEASDVARALMSGDLDAAFCSLGTVIANADGTALDVILVTNVSNGTDGIVARKGVASLRDLRGLRIGSKQNAINRLILAEALEHAGMSESDVVVEDVSNTTAIRLLREGLIDGAVLWEPDLSEVAEVIGGRVVYRTSEVKSSVVDTFVTRSDRASGREADIAGFREAWFELLEDASDRPDEVFGVVGDMLGQDAGALAEAWSGVRPGDAGLNREVLGEDFGALLVRTARYLRSEVPLSIRVSPGPWAGEGSL